MRWTWAFAIVLVAPILAGCVDEASPPAPGLPASALAAGNYYAFVHSGGAITFTLAGQGEASFELYGADDQRIGGAGLSASATQQGLHRISGIAPGSVVVRILTLTGILQVESGERGVVAFTPLLTSITRIQLLDLPPSSDPLESLGLGFLAPTGDPYEGTADVHLPRAPANLRVLASGPWNNLVVAIDGDNGRMLVAEDPGSSPGNLGSTRALQSIAGSVTPQNLRAGNATAHIQADQLAGAVVLEVETFSRARQPLPGAAGPHPADVPFTYGPVPAAPAAFNVHPRAKALYLWQPNGTQDARVALFGPHDEPLGVAVVPAAGSLRVATQGGGEYVVARLDGNVSLGADRTPAAFDLRPLMVHEETVPGGPAGSNGRYAIADEFPQAIGVYQLVAGQTAAATPELTPSLQFQGCDDGRYVEVLQGNETLATLFEAATAETHGQALASASSALRGGPLQVRHDGFGDDGCAHFAVTLRSYERPI